MRRRPAVDIIVAISILKIVASALRDFARALHEESEGGRKITPNEWAAIKAGVLTQVSEIMDLEAQQLRSRIERRERRGS